MSKDKKKLSIEEWFDPNDVEHLRAFTYIKKHGNWPAGFLPDNVDGHIRGSLLANKIAYAYAVKSTEDSVDYKNFNKIYIQKVKNEAIRVLDLIDQWEQTEPYDYRITAAIKRATLDFNRVAVILRKGFYKYMDDLKFIYNTKEEMEKRCLKEADAE